uniref:NADH-ubiquinone oxidoreductase chain 5 n=1 Tax=Pronodularia japanensis TaxID=1835347 RepID=Q94QP8_9BIVA|nr:NADH dehydrogenase complex 5 [Pronodularia japanensis]
MKLSGKSASAKSDSCTPLVWASTFLLSCFVLWFIWFGGVISTAVVLEWEFFSACGFSLSVLLLLDFLGALFSFVVCLISGCVFIFSVSYMSGDKFHSLFYSLVAAFVAAMNILILIPNLVFVLLGWDLLGIISFLLVVYYQNSVSVGAGMLTVLMNRIGDVFLVLAIGFSSSAGIWGILEVEQLAGQVVWVGVLLVGAGMTKSAQIPFSVWLPAAMAAPTPVSALVYSSTLVTVGVYFLFRHYHVLMCVNGLLPLLSKVGCLTLLMASLGACLELDIKKLVALSTLSHLGFMVYVLGVGYPVLSVFHLLSHALFKSLLFLCAGHYMHEVGCSQDIRQMSGVGWGSSPLVMACIIIGLNSLCGVPYLSGFYSKDAILEGSMTSFVGALEILCLVVGAGASCLHAMRLLLYSIFGPLGGLPLVGESGVSGFVAFPVLLLALGSICFSYVMQQAWAEASLSFSLSFLAKVGLFLALNLGVVILATSVLGFGYSGGSLYGGFSSRLMAVKLFLSSMWFFRWWSFAVPGVWFSCGSLTVSAMEMGWMEVIGGRGVGGSFVGLGSKLWVMEGISVLNMLRLAGGVLLVLGVHYF